MKVKFYLAVTILSLAVLPIAVCDYQPGTSPAVPPPLNQIPQEVSRKFAEDFLKNSPTFVFDGIEDSLKLTKTLTARCPSCWVFTFEFDSRHAGYGDRARQVLAQVLTPHRATIGVEQGKIKSAVMDDKWDMLNQKTLD